jgi:hypothetical protein
MKEEDYGKKKVKNKNLQDVCEHNVRLRGGGECLLLEAALYLKC